MKRRALLLALSFLGAMTIECVAQSICVTPSGSCAMNVAGVAGRPCLCATAAGNIQGITGGPSAGAPVGDAFPHYCCTTAGRMGPFPNMNVAPGRACEASSQSGRVTGQACF